MAAKLSTIDKRVSASPDQYKIPSKMVEKQGKTMGMLLGSSLESLSKLNVPGPGSYLGEKLRKDDFRYSIGAKFGPLK